MRVILFTFLLLLSIEIDAQSSYSLGLLPSLNVTPKFGNNWKINLKIEARMLLKEGIWGEKHIFDYNYQLTDISTILTRKTGLNHSLGVGYLSRFKQGEIAHRFIQQFAIIQRRTRFRFVHRLSSDQTFQHNHTPKFRFRYRLSTDFPLLGQSINPKELYMKVNHEYLHAFKAGTYDLEVRLVPMLGYEFLKSKLEWGIDYRLDSFIQSNVRQRFWIILNWYASLDCCAQDS